MITKKFLNAEKQVILNCIAIYFTEREIQQIVGIITKSNLGYTSKHEVTRSKDTTHRRNSAKQEDYLAVYSKIYWHTGLLNF